MKTILIKLIRWYQRTPTSLHDKCRYTPTCSEYMALAIEKYGVLLGLWKGCRRLIRCRPPYGGTDYP